MHYLLEEEEMVRVQPKGSMLLSVTNALLILRRVTVRRVKINSVYIIDYSEES